MTKWGLREDVKNLTLITVSGLLAVGFSGAALSGRGASELRYERRVVAPLISMPSSPVSGSGRLYGRVATRDGAEHTGYIRWDRNEGSWADLLDANKAEGTRSQSGIRFGHVRRIQVTGRERAHFTLRSGAEIELAARATDLGMGLRALVVEDPAVGPIEFGWRDLESVEFFPAPEGLMPLAGRLHGTLTTRSGAQFTGYVTWDVDEIYTSDVLDGEQAGEDRQVEFGAIASIERHSSDAARVTLRGGAAMVLDGSNDVDDSNGGISVSDPMLGQVKVGWDEFDRVEFHDRPSDLDHGSFDGGTRLQGIVVTEDGRELVGEVSWDDDETATWELLNGRTEGIDFAIEFSAIARIQKTDRGAVVQLRDGRAFEIEDSNDVNDGNRGIVVEGATGSWNVSWDDFSELRLDG